MQRPSSRQRHLSRRQFVQGLAAGGVAASLGLLRARSATAAGLSANELNPLTGNAFRLTIGQSPVNFTGRARSATTINGGIPGPLLRWKQGTDVSLQVRNTLPVSSSIHWHGILLPTGMDGVPGLSFPGIGPGETFTYRFPVTQSGTYWYHSHSGFQEQTGLYGPLVIEPAAGERHAADREHVIMLSDWTDEDPMSLFGTLKKHSDFYNFAEPTTPEFLQDLHKLGMDKALARRRMWNRMRMSPADLADVSGYTYTYLMNGNSPAANWTGLFKRGERVRLRFINGSAMSFFDVRIPGLKMTVVAADGQDVEPVTVDEFRIAVAETCDVMVEPDDDRAYAVFAASMDRTGYARGTLTTHPDLHAKLPEMDPRARLTMVDMMGAMAMTGGSGKHDLSGMHGMDMKGAPPAHHARSEYGPGVDMRVDMPRDNIDDPGIGLRDNGRRVLTYADLHTIGGPLDARDPAREIELHLTGNMERYMWSFDGQKFADAYPLHFRYGEHLRVTLVNDTMMTHPIHLHGMWSELESPDGAFQVRKHTISVQPAQRVSYRVKVDARGRWAYHCHLLYHMEAGMFREVVVS
ncbi:MAG: copper resistance system multicopper oxidase [Rhodanobacteraceae bacterium]